MAQRKQSDHGIGEREVIARIQARFPAADPRLLTGIGDDAAVISQAAAGQGLRLNLPDQVVTTDILIEGVHFDRRYMRLADVGYKALAVNLSDVAAMGARPRFACGTLGLPAGAGAAEVDELLSGVAEAAQGCGVELIGGDTVAAPQWVVGFTVLGEVTGAPLLRSGARPGDVVWHSGRLGLAQVGLAVLTAGGEQAPDPPWTDAVQALKRPQARLDLGAVLQQQRLATACLDLSDSLSQCLLQLSAASGVGLHLDLSGYAFPTTLAAYLEGHRRRPKLGPRAFAVPAKFDPRGRAQVFATWADYLLAAAEDYELLFTAPPEVSVRLLKASPVPLTRIGTVVDQAEGCYYRAEDGRTRELSSTGFEHR